MENYLKVLLIVCPLVFIAAFIDAIAGGGGIISVPAYVLAGLPMHVVYGCNKFAASIGQVFAVYKYKKNGSIKVKESLAAAVTSLVGASIGSSIVMLLDDKTLKIMLMVVLPVVAIFLLTRKSFTNEAVEPKVLTKGQMVLYPALIGLGCGFYDGLFGPGTGTFLILAFTTVMGYDLMTSSGCAKLINLCSNLGSLIVYFIGGKILYSVAIPAAISMSIGSYLGSHAAIKHGAKFIRPTIFLVLAMLLVKILYDFFIMK